jgi:hypothetical protein
MKTIILKSFNLFVLLSVLAISPSTYSQSQSSFKRTTATILFASIGGGVLGLSTLSFYGKPQEHTDNITTGVLIGFIAGLSYVMYDTYGLQSAAPFTETEKRYLMVRAEDQSKKVHLNPGWQIFSYKFSW